jgi:hypothetical protein
VLPGLSAPPSEHEHQPPSEDGHAATPKISNSALYAACACGSTLGGPCSCPRPIRLTRARWMPRLRGGTIPVVNSPDLQIVISRPSGKYRDAMRRYRIEMDGERVGDIGPGEELAIPASAGTHTVQARIDWSGSPLIEVVVTDQRTPRLVVRPAGSAAGVVPALGTQPISDIGVRVDQTP